MIESSVLVECLGSLLVASLPSSGGITDTIAALTAGVNKHGACGAFAAKEETAYAMAAGILLYLEAYSGSYEMDIAVQVDLVALLKDWLKPPVPWGHIPTVNHVANAFFGDAWRTIFEDSLSGSPLIGDFVFSQRPPFMLGLCPEQDNLAGRDLPDLVFSP